MPDQNLQICTRCTYDSTVPRITFDKDGVCNYCHQHDELCAIYPDGDEGMVKLRELADEVRLSAKGKKYDCIVGVSGGCDSSFLLQKTVELGLKPLAVHFDNTWNGPIATQNIYSMVNGLGVDLETYVVDSKEYDDMFRAFLVSGAYNLEAPNDLGLAAVLYRSAAKHGLKYIFEGHSFRTEGICPLDWNYMDGRYIKSVHRQYGKLPMKTYPLMTIGKFIKWVAWNGIRRVRPLYYTTYNKEQVKHDLNKDYGWEWYGGHHLESRSCNFWVDYFVPHRTSNDLRQLSTAAMVRSQQISREEGLAKLREDIDFPEEILNLVKKRLDLNDDQFDAAMHQPLKTWKDFPNYKSTFELLRPFFAPLVAAGRVPKSFYIKFCFPNE